MNEDVLQKYERKFGEMPPAIWGIDINSPDYLKLVELSIKIEKPLTRDDLAKVFYKDMDNNDVCY